MILVILPNPDYFCQRPIGRLRCSLFSSSTVVTDLLSSLWNVVVRQDADRGAVEIVILAALERPEDGYKPGQAEQQRDLAAPARSRARSAFSLAEVEVEAGRPDRARPLLAEGLLLTLLGTGIAGRQRLACRGR